MDKSMAVESKAPDGGELAQLLFADRRGLPHPSMQVAMGGQQQHHHHHHLSINRSH